MEPGFQFLNIVDFGALVFASHSLHFKELKMPFRYHLIIFCDKSIIYLVNMILSHSGTGEGFSIFLFRARSGSI